MLHSSLQDHTSGWRLLEQLSQDTALCGLQTRPLEVAGRITPTSASPGTLLSSRTQASHSPGRPEEGLGLPLVPGGTWPKWGQAEVQSGSTAPWL